MSLRQKVKVGDMKKFIEIYRPTFGFYGQQYDVLITESGNSREDHPQGVLIIPGDFAIEKDNSELHL